MVGPGRPMSGWKRCRLANQPLVQNAANDGKEPRADLLVLCCVRSQRGNCCNCGNLYAAVRRNFRPFRRAAAETTRPRIKSQDIADVGLKLANVRI